MSLLSKVQQVKGERKSVFRKTSTCRNRGKMLQVIRSYIDETTKKDKPEGLYYLTKNNKGRLLVGGFLREEVLKQTGKFPHQMEPIERVEACARAWRAQLDKRKDQRTTAVGHKFIVSLAAPMTDLMAEMGHDSDELLDFTARNIMRRYQEKFYPDSKLGYLIGLHHDTRHAHAHIYLFPDDDKGKLLRVSNASHTQGGAAMLDFMYKTSEKTVERHFRTHMVPMAKLATREPSEITQRRLLIKLASIEEKQASPSVGHDEHWARTSRRYLDMLYLPPAQLQKKVNAAYELQHKQFQVLPSTNKTGKELDKLSTKAASDLALQRDQIQEQFKALRREMISLGKVQKEIAEQRKKLFHDLTSLKQNKWAFTRSISGGFMPRDPERYQWLLTRMAEDDRIGKLMREPLGDQAYKAIHKSSSSAQMGDYSRKNVLGSMKFVTKDFVLRGALNAIGARAQTDVNFRDRFFKQLKDPNDKRDVVRTLFEEELKEHSKRGTLMNERRAELLKRMEALKLYKEVTVLDGLDRQMKIESKEPLHISQYRACQTTKSEIPLSPRIPKRFTPLQQGYSMAPEWIKEAHATLMKLRMPTNLLTELEREDEESGPKPQPAAMPLGKYIGTLKGLASREAEAPMKIGKHIGTIRGQRPDEATPELKPAERATQALFANDASRFLKVTDSPQGDRISQIHARLDELRR